MSTCQFKPDGTDCRQAYVPSSQLYELGFIVSGVSETHSGPGVRGIVMIWFSFEGPRVGIVGPRSWAHTRGDPHMWGVPCGAGILWAETHTPEVPTLQQGDCKGIHRWRTQQPSISVSVHLFDASVLTYEILHFIQYTYSYVQWYICVIPISYGFLIYTGDSMFSFPPLVLIAYTLTWTFSLIPSWVMFL